MKQLEALKPICSSCKREIDISESIKLAEQTRIEIQEFEENLNHILGRLKFSETQFTEDILTKKAINEFDSLSSSIDNELPELITSEEELDEERKTIKALMAKIAIEISKAETINTKVSNHNAKIEYIKEQIEQGYIQKVSILEILEVQREIVVDLEILVKAFSPNGLVGYKLEYLTKDLELIINEYLEELSRGRFQLNFILNGDKLDIEITDEGNIITINELSEGELAKVNVSTLLAIRKLMQQLSNTKLNILFLDEIMGVLDGFGREDLINILLKEDSLNTYLVTHEYTHPLVPTITVARENNLSYIEEQAY